MPTPNGRSNSKNSNKTEEKPKETKGVQIRPGTFPVTVSEYTISKGLNSFEKKVFIKAMQAEPGVGAFKKLYYEEWDEKRAEYYSRKAN
jgi:hypothetical protein